MKILKTMICAAMLAAGLCGCKKIDLNKLEGTWSEQYDPTVFAMDGSVEYTFDGNNHYQLHTYDALEGGSHDYTGTYAIDLIKKFGIEYETLTESATLPLESYTVTQTRRQWTEVLGIYPVNVQVRTERHQVTLPAGSIRVSMSQPLATLAGILLEPECANGFVNFCVIEAKTGTTLQIYRSVGNK